MGALFADHQPDLQGTPAEVDVELLDRAHLDACVALAVEREGGPEARWKASLERSLDSSDRATLVALIDREVAGYGTVGWLAPSRSDSDSATPDGWYLLGLVVAPQHRRKGVGRLLTAARLGWIAPRSNRVWYFVSSANRASIDLHTELGFQLIATDIKVPGVAFTESGELYAVDLPWPVSIAFSSPQSRGGR